MIHEADGIYLESEAGRLVVPMMYVYRCISRHDIKNRCKGLRHVHKECELTMQTWCSYQPNEYLKSSPFYLQQEFHQCRVETTSVIRIFVVVRS